MKNPFQFDICHNNKSEMPRLQREKIPKEFLGMR